MNEFVAVGIAGLSYLLMRGVVGVFFIGEAQQIKRMNKSNEQAFLNNGLESLILPEPPSYWSQIKEHMRYGHVGVKQMWGSRRSPTAGEIENYLDLVKRLSN